MKKIILFLFFILLFVTGCNNVNIPTNDDKEEVTYHFELIGGKLVDDVYYYQVNNSIDQINVSTYYNSDDPNIKLYEDDLEISVDNVSLYLGNNEFIIKTSTVEYKINVYRNKILNFDISDYYGNLVNKFYYEENVDFSSYQSALEALAPEKIGYTWKGFENLDEVLNDESHVLISTYEQNKYQITFSINNEKTTKEIGYSDKIEFPKVVPEDGYEFTYWTANGMEFKKDVYNYTDNITLVAHFKKVALDLNYELYGGSTTYATLGEDGNIKFGTASLSGYNFKGWYLDPYFLNPVSTFKYADYNGEKFYAKFELNNINLKGTVYYELHNKQTDLYDDVSLYDQGVFIMASLYWYKVGIKEELGQYFISGIAKSGTAVSTLSDADYIMLVYGNCPFYNSFVSVELNVGDEVVFAVDPDSEETDMNNIVSILNPTGNSRLKELQNYLEGKYNSVQSVDKDIKLVDAFNDLSITWESSKPNIISNTGKFTKPERSQSVVLKAYYEKTLVYSLQVSVVGTTTDTYLSTGYIASNFAGLTQNAMNKLDIVYPSFLYIDANGDFTNLSSVKNLINTYIKPLADKSGTRIVISLNQYDAGNFNAVATNTTNLKKMCANLVKLVQELGIDGIDIDWETPAASAAGNFTILMKELYTQMKAANPAYLVTAAIGGGMWQPPKYDLANSKDYMDYINLMTYSMCSGSGYYQNALYPSTKGATLVSCSVSESVEVYNKYGVPNNMILVGVAFYATKQTNCDGPGSKTGSGSSCTRTAMYNGSPLSSTCKDYYDSECCVPYRYDSVNKVFYSFDNDQSIKDKSQYIIDNGLAGMMFWQYGQAIDDDLVNSMYKYLK